MELYLHIGTNKTASSYLQTLQTQNKALLEMEGIYVPPSPWDADMLKGVITPGNGHELAQILCRPKKLDEILFTYLRKLKIAAEQKKCHKIILSNEILIRLFSNRDLLSSLSEAVATVGFVRINMFCVLRNPYEHALSLYKHRMKSGKIWEYAEWLENDYKTLSLLDLFMDHYNDFKNIHWTFKIYKKDSTFLVNSYFRNFLNLQAQIPEVLAKSVNPSISLSGIKIMELMNRTLAGAGRNFYSYCMENEMRIAESPFLVDEFFNTYRNYVNATKPTSISRIAKLLPQGEALEFESVPKDKSLPELKRINNVLFLKESEIQTVCKIILKTKEQEIGYRIRFFVNQLKNKLKKKHNNFDSSRYGGSLRT